MRLEPTTAFFLISSKRPPFGPLLAGQEVMPATAMCPGWALDRMEDRPACIFAHLAQFVQASTSKHKPATTCSAQACCPSAR